MSLHAPLLPGDYLEDIESSTIHLHVAYSATGYPIALMKYAESESATPWRRPTGVHLERLIETYAPQLAASRGPMIHDPYYGVYVPTVKGRLLIHYSSRGALEEAFRRPWCRMAEVAAELAAQAGLREAGITGSLLLAAQHSRSDIDIVVHGYRSALRLVEEHPGDPLPARELAAWASGEARHRWITPLDAARMYRAWSRMRYRGYTVSVSLQAPSAPWRRTITYTRVMARCTAAVKPYQETVMEYPAVVREFEGCTEYAEVIVLDGFYKPALFEGGVYDVLGLQVLVDGEKALLVGDREKPGYIKPHNP